jgi:aspartate kinase
MIVMKFGGTSVESASAIARVAGIVKARAQRRPVVVVSAMGKTTNKLLAIADLAVRGDREEALERIGELRTFHLKEAHELIPEGRRRGDLDSAVNGLFDELEELARGISCLEN